MKLSFMYILKLVLILAVSLSLQMGTSNISYAETQSAVKSSKESPKKKKSKRISKKKKKSKKRKKKKKRIVFKGSSATVIVDGAAVYKGPSFDSPIIDYLQMGKKITAKKKVVKGAGGFGSFYKVKVGRSKIGYMSDVEVSVSGKKGPELSDTKDEGIFKTEDPKDPPKRLEPIYFTRYIGVSLGAFNFTEVVDKKEVLQSSVTAFGLKMSGPGALFDGPPIDFNLSFVASAPAHHEQFTKESSGFILITDILMVIPLKESGAFMAYVGFGPMLLYSKYTMTLADGTGPIDSQEINAGLAGSGGIAVRFGRSFLVKLEGKYYYEENQYFGGGAAMQMTY